MSIRQVRVRVRKAAHAAALAAVIVLISALPALAFSQGPRFAGAEASCTFLTCGEADGTSDNRCSNSSASAQQVTLTGYGFTVPSNASITGFVVEVKGTRTSTSPTVQLLQAGSPVGTAKTANLHFDGDGSSACSETEFLTLGTATDPWGATWTPAQVNAPGFGVRINSTQGVLIDAVRITAHFTIDTAVCGDGFATHDEQCDDGNSARADGCSPACQVEVALAPGAALCLNTVNKDITKVESAQAKLALSCLKSAQKGNEADAQACLTADAKGTVAKAAGKTQADADERCAPPPAYGFTSAAAATGAATGAGLDLVADVFGADLAAAVIDTAASKEGAACQAAVLQGLQKLVDARTKLFLSCKKRRLAADDDPVLSAWDLQQCFGDVATDGKGSIGKAVDTLQSAVAAKCAGVALPAAFPGHCSGATAPATLSSCLDTRVACRVCEFLNAADGLGEDCDVFDDGSDNASCP